MSKIDCILCKTEFEIDTYGEGNKCPKCGQIYGYDEVQIIRLSEDQKNVLRDLAKGIDYKEILRKYANHVADNEGTDFICAAHLFEGEARLSKEEIKILREITGWDEDGKNFSFDKSKRG